MGMRTELPRRGRVHERFRVLVVDAPDRQRAAGLLQGVGGCLRVGAVGDYPFGRGEADQVGEFVGAILGVDGDERRARKVRPQVADDPLRAVVGKERHAITGADAGFGQRLPDRQAALDQLRVGDAVVFTALIIIAQDLQGHLVGKFPSFIPQALGQRHELAHGSPLSAALLSVPRSAAGS